MLVARSRAGQWHKSSFFGPYARARRTYGIRGITVGEESAHIGARGRDSKPQRICWADTWLPKAPIWALLRFNSLLVLRCLFHASHSRSEERGHLHNLACAAGILS